MTRISIIAGALLVCVAVVLYLTQLLDNRSGLYNVVFYSRLALTLTAVFLAFNLTRVLIIGSLVESRKKYVLPVMSLLILCLLTEAGFMFVSRSFGTSYPLADQNWMRKYWQPINALGYRDAEVNPENAENKQNVLVLGSSYVAGDGIESVEQRFSNILNAQLPEQYEVYNLGLCGSNARDAYDRLLNYPVKPDLLVLSHTTKSINGVKPVTPSKLNSKYKVSELLPAPVSFLVKNSYALNYVFWKLIGPGMLADNHMEDIENNPVFYYLQEEMLASHFADLDKFINYCREAEIPLLVVSFPAMNNGIAITKMIVNNPVEAYFSQRNITAISVYDLVKDLPREQRTVNSNDSHPSELVHKLIAETLFNTIAKGELVAVE